MLEIMKESYGIFRRNLITLAGWQFLQIICVSIILFIFLALLFAFLLILGVSLPSFAERGFDLVTALSGAFTGIGIILIILLFTCFIFLSFAITGFFNTGLVGLCLNAIRGNEISIGTGIEFGKKFWITGALATFLYTLITGIPGWIGDIFQYLLRDSYEILGVILSLFLALASLIISFFLLYYIQSIVIDEKNAIRCLIQSASFVKNNLANAFVLIVLIILIAILGFIVISTPFGVIAALLYLISRGSEILAGISAIVIILGIILYFLILMIYSILFGVYYYVTLTNFYLKFKEKS
ncbi:MAG: hypothetical protein ACE5K4_07585 [Candidatus Hydrothermarchaeota archaeon]